ncbi:MAG: glycosyltransferase family 39 protein [Campylobacterales bacterium]|nr:glycosyltransferase family 39 protein [Campylobacterales bacterium]
MTKHYAPQIKVVGAILLLKLVLLALIPLTGDEAYFIKWADNLSSGYYDHPPMVGWLIYLMSFIHDSIFFFRLFSFMAAITVAYAIYKIAQLYMDENRAYFLFLLFLASPVNILMSLFTNDIPLVLFGTLGTMFLLYSFHKTNTLFYAVLSGVFLGAAFLSKYFSVFLLLSLAAFIFITYRTKAIKNALIVSVIVLLAVGQNLCFNYNCCWNNIMFNFFARTESHYNLETFGNFVLNLLYVVTPWAFYFLYKSRKNFVPSELLTLLTSILGLMFTVFFLVSLKNQMGIHWFVLFIPYLFLLFSYLDDVYLHKLFKYNTVFTFMHIAILIPLASAIHLLPLSFLQSSYYYEDAVFAKKTKETCEILDTSFKDKPLFTIGYTNSSMLNYYCKKDAPMIFSNSTFGRMDDRAVDFRELDNKNIYLFNNREMKKEEYTNVCKDVDVHTFSMENATFYVTTCNGFSYEKYKEHYLKIQKEKFYRIPEFLPKGKCYFDDRYEIE